MTIKIAQENTNSRECRMNIIYVDIQKTIKEIAPIIQKNMYAFKLYLNNI